VSLGNFCGATRYSMRCALAAGHEGEHDWAIEVPPSEAHDGANTAPVQWEYQVRTIATIDLATGEKAGGPAIPRLLDVLDHEGRHGWEVCGVLQFVPYDLLQVLVKRRRP
jgi:hypothetical protein